LRLIGNTVVAYPHAQAQIASSPDPTQKSGKGLVRGVVQVYGICIRALHLPVIAVMIIGVMRLPHNERPCQKVEFGTICSKLCLCERPILQDMCISGGQESTQPSRPLVLLLSSCEKAGSSLKPLKLARFKHL